MYSGNTTHRTHRTGAHGVIAILCALAFLILPASADDSWQEAGVIIHYGDDRITWIWIPFENPETPVIDLLHSTELEMVTVGFGGLGEGVCQIDDTGCPAADCRQRLCQTSSSSPFWRMMKLSGDEWIMTSTGVSGTKAIDGDIYALSWSADTPELPIVTIDELALNAGADRDASVPLAAMRTDGETARGPTSPSGWGPAVGALGLVAIASGVLIFRARSSQGARYESAG